MKTSGWGWIEERIARMGDWLRAHSKKLSALLMMGIFGLLAWQFIRDWHSLPPGFFSSVSYPLLLASLVVLIPVELFVSLRWGLTLRAIDVPIEWWTSVRIWFLSQAGRYLPGGVWSYVGRFYLGRSEMSQEIVVASMVLETGLRVVSEVLVFLISLPFWANSEFIGERTVFLLIGGVGLGLLLLHPTVLERLSEMAFLQRMALGPVDLSRLRYRNVLALLAYYVLMVFMVGGAFYLLVAALYPLPVRLFLALTGSLAASVVLGFLIPLTPNGWGVREGLLAFLLSQMMPFSVAIVVSVAARIWLSLGEAVWIVAMISLRQALKHK